MLGTKTDFPEAFSFLKKAELVVAPPADARVFDLVIALDTATRDRLGYFSCKRSNRRDCWINIDHHTSNPRYGDLNYLDLTAPATGQIVFDLIQDQGYPLDLEIAEALFVAISTDTGSFRYRNTSAHTFEVVAELVRQGVDVAHISHYLYESQPKRRVLLLHELLQSARFYANDRIGTMALTLEKKKQLSIQPADTDGLIDVVRSIDTVVVAILFEELENSRVPSKHAFQGREDRCQSDLWPVRRRWSPARRWCAHSRIIERCRKVDSKPGER